MSIVDREVLFGTTDGTLIDGGCSRCGGYQRISTVNGIVCIDVLHAEGCEFASTSTLTDDDVTI